MLTTTITSPSTVNMMSNNKDRCFQCQDHGHIARNCPNISCFEYDEYGHIVMDCPNKIPPSGTSANHYQPRPHRSHHARSSSRHCYEEREMSQPHHHRHCSSNCHDPYIEAALDHDIGIIAIITGVAHNAPIPHTGVIAIDHTMTLHIDHTTDHPHTEAHHTTPEMEACCVHVHPTNLYNEIHIGHTLTPLYHKVNHITRRTP